MLQIPKSAPAGALEQVGGMLLPPSVASLASKDLGTEQTSDQDGVFLVVSFIIIIIVLARMLKKDKMDFQKSSLFKIKYNK